MNQELQDTMNHKNDHDTVNSSLSLSNVHRCDVSRRWAGEGIPWVSSAGDFAQQQQEHFQQCNMYDSEDFDQIQTAEFREAFNEFDKVNLISPASVTIGI